MNCSHCGRPLEQSIRINGYKSCPNCSQNNTDNEHIFYPDSDFGFTEHRITDNNPDGIQSHCKSCRGYGTTLHAGIRCSDMQ